ncbi:hypothetical protein NFI96_004230 [Prochilodus magdalenae]|nr:hypothetical protein NFI96_004230 [Prochilodus magdalenae]
MAVSKVSPLSSSYRPLIRRAKTDRKQVKTWPPGAVSALQDCFEHTDWKIFKEAATSGDSINLEEYTESVTGYISKCIDDVTVSKVHHIPPQPETMDCRGARAAGTRDKAFKSGDKASLRTARAKLSWAIREAKRTYPQKIHSHFQDTPDTRCMWRGTQAVTNYKTPSHTCDSDASLPNVLNSFYARFEAQNCTTAKLVERPVSSVQEFKLDQLFDWDQFNKLVVSGASACLERRPAATPAHCSKASSERKGRNRPRIGLEKPLGGGDAHGTEDVCDSMEVKPALICEKHKAPVADLPILVFCGKCQSSSTVLAKRFTLTGPRGVERQSGSAVTLSCHLSPELSAVTMEIRWFKGTDCVCLYKNRQVTEGRGYKGRVSLFTQELQRGNVSLQIRDCTKSDEGDYLCQVTNEDTTKECTVGASESRCDVVFILKLLLSVTKLVISKLCAGVNSALEVQGHTKFKSPGFYEESTSTLVGNYNTYTGLVFYVQQRNREWTEEERMKMKESVLLTELSVEGKHYKDKESILLERDTLMEKDKLIQEKEKLLIKNTETLQMKEKMLEEKEKLLQETKDKLEQMTKESEMNQKQLKDKETQLENQIKERKRLYWRTQ